MKYLKKCLLGLVVLLLIAALLLWFLPARWVMPWITPRLHGVQLQQVHGSLWDGRADQVTAADGRALGRLQWQLSRRVLLGQMHLQMDFDGPQVTFSGSLQQLPKDQVELSAVTAHIQLAALKSAPVWALGQPRGELQLAVGHALLQGGWPLQLQAQAQWQHAVMHTHAGDVALGELQLRAHAEGGVIQADLHDDGHGPLAVAGTLQLSPLGWRLDATLQPRQSDPALQHWLSRLAPPAADGTVHIQRSGGLAGSLPRQPSS